MTAPALLPWRDHIAMGGAPEWLDEIATRMKVRPGTVRRWRARGVPRRRAEELAVICGLRPEELWPEEWTGVPIPEFVRSWPEETWAGILSLHFDLLPTLDCGEVGEGRVKAARWQCTDPDGRILSRGGLLLECGTRGLKMAAAQLAHMLAQSGPYALDGLGTDLSYEQRSEQARRFVLDPEGVRRLRQVLAARAELAAQQRERMVADAKRTLRLLEAGVL